MSKNTQREVLNIMGNIYKHVLGMRHVCMAEECSNRAINSHLLMCNGILNYVAENGKVVELRDRSFESLKKNEYVCLFKEVGIHQAISYPIFCQNHDSELFKDIESGNVDYANYKHIALYCYRSLCAAIRKKEIEREAKSRMIESLTLANYVPELLRTYKRQMFAINHALSDMRYYKSEIICDLKSETQNFSFFKKELPIKGIYASTTSSMFMSLDEAKSTEISNMLFIHLIPTKEKSLLLLGFHKRHKNPKYRQYTERWQCVDERQIGVMLTDILLQTERWGMSPSLYHKLSKDVVEKFYELYQQDYMMFGQYPYEKLNIFKGVY